MSRLFLIATSLAVSVDSPPLVIIPPFSTFSSFITSPPRRFLYSGCPWMDEALKTMFKLWVKQSQPSGRERARAMRKAERREVRGWLDSPLFRFAFFGRC